MSDLSRLLGDVYHSDNGAGQSVTPPVDETWSQEQVDMLAPDEEEVAAPRYDLDDEWSMVQADELEADSSSPVSPDWADEDTLDEAFADWVPGPHDSAPEAEYFTDDDDADQFELLADGDAEVEQADHFAPDDDAFSDDDELVVADTDLDTTGQSESIDWTTSEPGYLAEEPVAAGPWRRSDDDLLPKSGGRRRSRKR